ncbi:MAG: transporter substrate-binding domain-containing protein [Bacteroidales bacterium]|nr:transporter substrate-binding domain-containing protein [Bacteroidales bacterium]
MKKIFFLILIFIPLFVQSRSLDEIKQSGVLYVAFTESAKNSINYKIANEFAQFLNVKLIVVETTWEDNFTKDGVRPDDLETNPDYYYTPDALKKADFICGTIYIYDWRKKIFDYAGIMQVSDLLVVRKTFKDWDYFMRITFPEEYLDLIEHEEIRTFEDLKGKKIALLANSSYEKNIAIINESLGNSIILVPTVSEQESQRLMKEGEVDGFITVSYLALKFINENPDLSKLAFPVGKPFDVGWAVENENAGLATEINNFYETIKGNGTLNKLFQNSYGIDFQTYLEIINSYTDNDGNTTRSYDDIIASGKLIVALRERELVYSRTGSKQFSHQLAESLANFLHLELEIRIAPSLSAYFEADDGVIYKDSSYSPAYFDDVDVACDLLAPVPWRMSKVDIIGYIPNATIVVGNKDQKITTVADLKKLKGVTAEGSSYEQALINNDIKDYYYVSSTEMLDDVASGKADYTLVSISIYNLPEYHNLEAKFILGEIQETGWAIKKNHPKLRQKILEFFDYAEQYGILDEYFKQQTGMPFKASEKYLIALHQTYNIGVFPFVFYGSDEGLPQENITSIYQDDDGYIWFGTFSGAVKFNGRTMSIFNSEKGMLTNEVMDIKQDSSGAIYFATLKGISIFNNGVFDSLHTGVPFKHILIDTKGRKWFYGDAGIIVDFDEDELIFNDVIENSPSNVHSIAEIINQNKFLIASSEGLYVFDMETYTLEQINNANIYYVFLDADEKIWISAKDGVYYTDFYNIENKDLGDPINETINVKSAIQLIKQTADGAIWLISNFKAYQIFSLNLSPIVYDQIIGLSGQKILSFYVDNEENIWFGYYGGVQKLTNKSLRVIYPEKLKFYVNTIIQDNLNHFWFSFNNTLFVLGDYLEELTYHFSDSYSSFVVTENSNENIIVASEEGFFEVDPKTKNILRKNIFDTKLQYLKNIFIDSFGRIFISSGYNGIVYFFDDFDSQPVIIENSSTTLLQDFYQIDDMVIGANNSGLVQFKDGTFKPLVNLNYSVSTIQKINNNIFVGTDNGLYLLEDLSLKKITIKNLSDGSITAISRANDTSHIWLGTNQGLNYVNMTDWYTEFEVNAQDGLPGNEVAIDGLLVDAKGMLWIGTLHGIATYDIKKKSLLKYTPDCRVESILLNGDYVNSLPPTLKYFENNFVFELSGLSFKNEQSIVYDYYLRGKNKIYSSSSGVPFKAAYQNLPPGKYTFLYRAKGKDGIWSYYEAFSFEILKPFWFRWWFIVANILLLIAIVYLIIQWREKALKAKNEELERLVKERTFEIEQKKSEIEAKNSELEQQQEEIIAQRDEITKQRDIAEKQRDIAETQREEIMDSIYYAKRIQAAILPPKKYLNEILPESFVLYKPRDIVSGDFYWIKQIDHRIVVVAADCTGHGVPGAFMSMLGSALLDEIVLRSNDDLLAGEILDNLRTGIVNALHQTGKVEEAKDGMDLALYILNPEEKSLQFSGAFNPLYIVRGEEMIELKADRKPIGIFEEVETPFTTHYFTPQKGDLLYTFSDGYASQFGGPQGKKFKFSRFQKIFLTIKDKPMDEQKAMLDKAFENWMGVKYEQIDDVIVVGVKYVWD